MIRSRQQPPLSRTPMAHRPFTGPCRIARQNNGGEWSLRSVAACSLFSSLYQRILPGLLLRPFWAPMGLRRYPGSLSVFLFSCLAGFHLISGPLSSDSWWRFEKQTMNFLCLRMCSRSPRRPVLRLSCRYITRRWRGSIRPLGRPMSHSRKQGSWRDFDIYILSDSVQSDSILMEETAWSELCRDVDGFGRIFYRRRKVRIHKKSGNVSDFCRRWGSQYKYMIIFDADSLMEGDLLVRMVNVMEAREDIGILQTAPMAANQISLISRLQQFASHVYGPLFFAGLRFWQLDESGYWGHNAIVRMAPFMKYCALPHLSGKPPFGGEILSHDFVEAALMRRAGWGVWLAYELEGSYEELPPSLFEELERDRRWCQGNIQHLRLMFMKGISFGYRLLFLNGNLFYFSSLLWLLLLLLMTVHAVADFFHTVVYFSAERSLFPHWPVQYRELSIHLLMVTAMFLLVPKILSVLLICSVP